MRDLIMKVGITYRKRYTPRQKKLFVKAVCEDLKEAGCQVMLAQHQGLFQKSNHVLIQQPQQAKKVIIAYYDTPSRFLWGHCDAMPFDPHLNSRNEKQNLFIQGGLSLLLLVMNFVLLFPFSHYSNLQKTAAVLLCCFLTFLIYLLTKGIANRFNYNRNSAAVALVVQCAKDCKDNPDIGFILMDRGCDNYLGLVQLITQFPQLKEKEGVLLESIAIGEMLVEARSASQDSAKFIDNLEGLKIVEKQFSLEKSNQTPLGFLKHFSWLVSGTIENRRLVVKNTRSNQDYHIDLPRLEKLRVMLKKWAEKEKI